MKNNIALLTDFGSTGQHYVASMKGVILTINPDSNIIDITHNVKPFSISNAAFLLKASYKHFPEGTIFIVVVDPGVGSQRDILAIKTKHNYYFIGPDNGIFPQALQSKIIECVKIENQEYFNKHVSNTFHGRDIMAPVAAHISNGIFLSKFGTEFLPNLLVTSPSQIDINKGKKEVSCIVQHIDSFGNIVTNIAIRNNLIKGSSLLLSEGASIQLSFEKEIHKGKFVSHFASGSKDSLIFLKGSSNYLEISKNQGNAAKDLSLQIGDNIEIDLV